MGLMDYHARFYSPYLNRFIQPDSIIPDPSSPQAWNRYSYVSNRPINFNDPSGHMLSCGDFGCGGSGGGGGGGDDWWNDDEGSGGGGGSGGGDDDSDDIDDDLELDSCSYHLCSEEDTSLYEVGWQNFGQAWSTWSNPNASYGQQLLAGTYMSYWGGAHAMLVVGGTILIWQAIGIIAMHASADGDPTNEIRTFYRGDASGLSSMISKAGQISQEYVDDLLTNGNISKLMQNHAKNSSAPPSPFVSVTTDPAVARFFAGPGGTVYEIVTSRAIQNIYGLPGEEEWLVPAMIHMSEIVGRVLVP